MQLNIVIRNGIKRLLLHINDKNNYIICDHRDDVLNL